MGKWNEQSVDPENAKDRTDPKLPLRPDIVYLDTNAIDSAPPNLNHPELQQLMELCRELNIRVAIPELALREFAEHKKQKVLAAAKKIADGTDDISRYSYTSAAPRIEWPLTIPELLGEIDERIKSTARAVGIEILENYEGQDYLENLAVKGTRPFGGSGSDRGFKDAVILLTVVNHLRALGDGHDAVVITSDKGMKEGFRDLPDTADLTIQIIDDLRSTVETIRSFQSAEQAKAIGEILGGLRDYVMMKKADIEAFLRRIELMESDFEGKLPPFHSVENLISVQLTDVRDPLPGLLPEDEERGRVPLSFVASLRVNAEIRSLQLQMPQRIFRVGKTDTPSGPTIRRAFDSAPDIGEVITTASIPSEVVVRGSVFLDFTGGKAVWSGLQLDTAEVRPGTFGSLFADLFRQGAEGA